MGAFNWYDYECNHFILLLDFSPGEHLRDGRTLRATLRPRPGRYSAPQSPKVESVTQNGVMSLVWTDLHTQKRHRPVTRPVAPSGLIQVWYHSCIRLLSRTNCSELTVSDWNSLFGLSGLYQSDVTEWYRYVGNRLLQSVRTGCNRHDEPTALMEVVGIR